MLAVEADGGFTADLSRNNRTNWQFCLTAMTVPEGRLTVALTLPKFSLLSANSLSIQQDQGGFWYICHQQQNPDDQANKG